MAAKPWIMGAHRGHDASFCLLHGAEIAVAIQEERLVGVKHASLASHQPMDSRGFGYCLSHAGLRPEALDLLCGHIGEIPGVPLRVFSHHLSHAMSAFVLSGMDSAAVLVVDGRGDSFNFVQEHDPCTNLKFSRPPGTSPDADLPEFSEIISIYRFDRRSHEALEKHYGYRGSRIPSGAFHSFGNMYRQAARRILIGDIPIKPGSAADTPGKLMGLAPYGRPTTPRENFFSISSEGEFEFGAGVKTGAPWPAHRQERENLAASVQAALEEALLYLARRARQLSGCARLCYAGGVALNSVANERLVREAGFDEVFIPPPAHDAGLALGSAFLGLRALGDSPSRSGAPPLPARRLRIDSFGRSYTAAEIESAIEKTPCVVAERVDAVQTAAQALAEGRIIGWFIGGAEFGPRALGQRSILCDPRLPDGKDILNSRVKFREPFRPFAPAILQSETPRWFETPANFTESPFMLRVLRFREGMGERVPAVSHIDNTGRVQTVGPENGRFFALLRAFEAQTGVPILLNTSFNVMGGPIVETPADALWCLLYTGLDAVVMEDFFIRKAAGYRSLLDLRLKFDAPGSECTAPEFPWEQAAREILCIPPPPRGRAGEGAALRLLPEDVGPEPSWVLRLDGSRSGWEILAQLQQSEGDSAWVWDEKRLGRALNRLYLLKALVFAS